LRLYKSPAEILMGFDIDCCSVGFDGVRVWANPRCARALKMQYNLVDLTRRSPSYEVRLFKYSKRGFSVAVPGFDREKVDTSKFNGVIRPMYRMGLQDGYDYRFRGLALLLLLELLHHKVQKGNFNRQWTGIRSSSVAFDGEKEEIHFLEKQNTISDYSSVHIPYGPKWDARRCREHINSMNMRANDHFYRFHNCDPPRAQVVLCLIGSMSEVLEGKVNTGEPEGRVMDYEAHDGTMVVTFRHVSKDEMWITENPGAQSPLLTGSFTPINTPPEEWYNTAYKDPSKASKSSEHKNRQPKHPGNR